MTPIPPPEPPPPLRIPDWPLPEYRYVPGLHPHPFRHPSGHSYTDGSAPDHPSWSPDTPWKSDRAYLRGMDLFDQRYFWESHELWEGVWQQMPRDSTYALLLQSLIQSGAYCLKVHVNDHVIADRLLARVSQRLALVITREGPVYRGLHLPTLMDRLRAFPTEGSWPTLHA